MPQEQLDDIQANVEAKAVAAENREADDVLYSANDRRASVEQSEGGLSTRVSRVEARLKHTITGRDVKERQPRPTRRNPSRGKVSVSVTKERKESGSRKYVVGAHVNVVLPSSEFPPYTLPSKNLKMQSGKISGISIVLDQEYLKITLDDGKSLVDLPVQFIGPWGPFEIGEEVKALFPDLPDRKLYAGRVVKKHFTDGGEAVYDLMYHDGDSANSVPASSVIPAVMVLQTGESKPRTVNKSLTGHKRLRASNEEKSVATTPLRKRSRRLPDQAKESLELKWSSPVAKGASDISTDWDANANEDTPPQERYSGPTSALRNQEIRPPMLENHTCDHAIMHESTKVHLQARRTATAESAPPTISDEPRKKTSFFDVENACGVVNASPLPAFPTKPAPASQQRNGKSAKAEVVQSSRSMSAKAKIDDPCYSRETPGRKKESKPLKKAASAPVVPKVVDRVAKSQSQEAIVTKTRPSVKRAKQRKNTTSNKKKKKPCFPRSLTPSLSSKVH